MQYRPEIDGLRAVAVIPVILFHAGFDWAAGGYIGVDIFFVISGYLITGIILKDIDREQFSLIRFYERRARRILPALLVVVLACIPLSIWLMVPFQLRDFSQSIIATLLFASNFYFWKKSDYFEADSESMPLLHTWSLAIEEQFYLVFPLLLLFLFRRGKKFLVTIVIAAGIASLLAAEYGWRASPAANFYFPTTRAWQLLAGALCAIYLQNKKPKSDVALASIGLSFVIASIVLFGPNTPHPSALTLLPVIGVVLLLLFTDSENNIGRLLSLPILSGVGLISYSAYLWHVPLLAFLQIYFFSEPPLFAIYIAILATFILAYSSWRYIEQPVRKKTSVSHRAFLSTTGSAATLLLFIGAAGVITDGLYSTKLDLANTSTAGLVIDRDEVLAVRREFWAEIMPRSNDPFKKDRRHKILVLGDSLSQDLMVTLSVATDFWQRNQFRRLALDDSCMALAATAMRGGSTAGKAKGKRGKCTKQTRSLLDSEVWEAADEIVLAANWQRATIQNAINFASAAVELNKEVAIQGIASFNDMASLSFRLPSSADAVPRFIFENRRGKYIRVSEELQALVAAKPEIRYLNKIALICDDIDRECDLFDRNGELMIYDSVHLTVDGARELSDRMMDAHWFSFDSRDLN